MVGVLEGRIASTRSGLQKEWQLDALSMVSLSRRWLHFLLWVLLQTSSDTLGWLTCCVGDSNVTLVVSCVCACACCTAEYTPLLRIGGWGANAGVFAVAGLGALTVSCWWNRHLFVALNQRSRGVSLWVLVAHAPYMNGHKVNREFITPDQALNMPRQMRRPRITFYLIIAK